VVVVWVDVVVDAVEVADVVAAVVVLAAVVVVNVVVDVVDNVVMVAVVEVVVRPDSPHFGSTWHVSSAMQLAPWSTQSHVSRPDSRLSATPR
jgi:hypothetical protein